MIHLQTRSGVIRNGHRAVKIEYILVGGNIGNRKKANYGNDT